MSSFAGATRLASSYVVPWRSNKLRKLGVVLLVESDDLGFRIAEPPAGRGRVPAIELWSKGLGAARCLPTS